MITSTSKCKYGLLTYPSNDIYVGGSLAAYGEYSPGETRLWEQFISNGMLVLDIGANLGAHTVALASMVGSGGCVVAFEPQPPLHRLLETNIIANGYESNVVALRAGASANCGVAYVPSINYDSRFNFGVISLTSEGIPTPLVSIDSLGLPHCEFIKIDVEGMEPAVLEGASETIKRFLPVIEVECDRPGMLDKLSAILEPLGYELYWHVVNLFEPDNFLGNVVNIFDNQQSINAFCVAGRYVNVPEGHMTRCKDLPITVVYNQHP